MGYPEKDMAETQDTSKEAAQPEDPRVAELRNELDRKFMAAVPPHLRDDTELSSSLLTLAHQLAEEQATQEREKAELEKRAVLDSLIPDFFDHKYFLHLLDLETRVATRKPTPDSALILLDFDNFSEVNNRFGHLAGDRLLKSAGKAMLESLRSGDDPGRVGGDELAAIVHRTTLDGAVAAARRLQAAVIKASQEEFGPQKWTQTISVGLCLITPGFSAEETFGIADRALYDSKHAGKNRISIAGFDPDTKSVKVRTLSPKPITPPTSAHT